MISQRSQMGARFRLPIRRKISGSAMPFGFSLNRSGSLSVFAATMRAKVIEPVLKPFCETLLWTRVESAEMVKHALNSYLATCVTFTNEIATICESVAADMSEVEAALRLDPRIGKKAYVRAGSAFGGGTLARDVQFLKSIAKDARSVFLCWLLCWRATTIIRVGWCVICAGNSARSRARRSAFLGLAYKAGTDAIRRSVAIEVIEELVAAGADVTVFDPKVSALPEPLSSAVTIASSVECGIRQAARLSCWRRSGREFRELDFATLIPSMKRAVLIDQNAFAAKQLAELLRSGYIVAGKVR